ncbi:MAG: hypothetical protein WCP39_04965, partial [Chlamydiota bacterium]
DGIDIKRSIQVLLDSKRDGEEKTLAKMKIVKCISSLAEAAFSFIGAVFFGFGVWMLTLATVHSVLALGGNIYEQVIQKNLQKQQSLLQKGLA